MGRARLPCRLSTEARGPASTGRRPGLPSLLLPAPTPGRACPAPQPARALSHRAGLGVPQGPAAVQVLGLAGCLGLSIFTPRSSPLPTRAEGTKQLTDRALGNGSPTQPERTSPRSTKEPPYGLQRPAWLQVTWVTLRPHHKPGSPESGTCGPVLTMALSSPSADAVSGGSRRPRSQRRRLPVPAVPGFSFEKALEAVSLLS